MAIFLSVVMVSSLISFAPTASAAAEDPLSTLCDGAIQSFEKFDNEIKVDFGASEEEAIQKLNKEIPTIPAVVNTVHELIPVTWAVADGSVFDGDTSGDYVFTAVIPDGMELADGVSLPAATVSVEENPDVQKEALADEDEDRSLGLVSVQGTEIGMLDATNPVVTANTSDHWIDAGTEFRYTTEPRSTLSSANINDPDTRTPTPVTTWNTDAATGLYQALELVNGENTGTFNENKPYVILVGSDISMNERYQITDKNIELRKASGVLSAEILQTMAGSATVSNSRHFYITGATSKLVLENGIALDGGFLNDGTDISTLYKGGIYTTATRFIFKGEIRYCRSATGGAISYNDGRTIELIDVHLHHNIAGNGNLNPSNTTGQGGAIAAQSWQAYYVLMTISGDSIIEDNFSGGYGGAIGISYKVGNVVTIKGNTKIINNRGANGGAIYCHGGILELRDNAEVSGNITDMIYPKDMAQSYPGTGGGIYFSGGTGTTTFNMSDNAKISNNVTANGGGGIYMQNENTVTLNLYGGEISGNIALGTARESLSGASAFDKISPGAGGGILAAGPQNIKIPVGSTITFFGNSAPFIALTGVAPDGSLPKNYTDVFNNDTNYYSHISASYADENNSAGFPSPYDNLYNNYDIGVPNNSQTAFGKLKVVATTDIAGTPGGSVTRTGNFANVFPAGADWIGLKVGTAATFTPVPDPGYRFTGWTRYSSVNPLTTEWPAWMTASQWSGSTNNSTSTATPSTNPTININSMPAADITLTANFELIPKAFLSGFSDMDWQADLLSGNYTQPGATAVGLVNSVPGLINSVPASLASDIKFSLSDFEKNGEVWSGTAPFAFVGAGATSIAGDNTDNPNTSWQIQPSGALTEPGNYTATLTMSYQNGVDSAPVISHVQLSFALIDPTMPLFLLHSIDFGSVVGSGYIVETDSSASPDGVNRKTITIKNLSAAASLLLVDLSGPGTNDFDIIPGSPTIPANGEDSSWQIVPKAGLAPGTHEAVIRVSYMAQDGSMSISSSAPVTFTVLKPAELFANPALYSFDRVDAGYIPSLEDIILTNNGDVGGFITGIEYKDGADVFTVINTAGSMSDETEVNPGSTNRVYEIAPNPGLADGFYTEVLTVSYYCYAAGSSAPSEHTLDITATIPVGVNGKIVTAHYLDIATNNPVKTAVSVFVEDNQDYTPPLANKDAFISGGKNYGYYGYQIDTNGIIPSTGLPSGITNVTTAHDVYYYYGTLDVSVDTTSGAGMLPSVNDNGSSLNVAYGSEVTIGVRAGTGYSFANWNQAVGQYTEHNGTALASELAAVTLTGRRTTSSFTAGYGTLTLTPQFDKHEYTIVIDSATNGGTGGGTGQATYEIGDIVNVTTTPSRPYSNFLGYAKAADGTEVSAYGSGFTLDASMISDLFAGDTETISTLYAIFEWTDVTPPTATVDYKAKSAFEAFLNKITFGLFFKADVVVAIKGADTESGVATVEYFTDPTDFTGYDDTAMKAYANNSARVWTSVTGSTATFSITSAQRGELHIFARVTDKAGNASVYYDGLLIFSDSVQTSASAEYTKLGTSDASVPVTLNGNTVSGIVNSTDSNTPLGAGDFSFSAADGGSITVDNAYLDTLDIGTYVFTVSYYPQGKTYTADADSRVEQPTTTTFEILVRAAAQSISLTGLSTEYTYGDAPDTDIGVTGGSGSGGVHYELTAPTDGSVNIADNPPNGSNTATLTILKPGNFEIKATKAGDATYGEATTTSGIITVNKAVPAVSVSGSGGSNLNADVFLNATVSKASPSAATPTGSVDIYVDNNRVKQNEPLVGGKVENYNLGKLSGGSHTLEVRYNGDNYYKGYGASDTADLTTSGAKDDEPFSVGLASDSITIAQPVAKVYGDSDFPLTLSASGTGSGSVTWALDISSVGSTVATIATDGTVHIIGTGSVTFKATKAGTTDHNGCTDTVTINIGKATPTLLTPPSGSGITYGEMLSESTLSGGSVTGYGTDSSKPLNGTFTWTTLNEIPDVTGLNTANDYYSVTWTPSGADADHYDPVASTVAQNTRATLTVGRANVTLATPLHGSGINTGVAISNSVISGGEVTYKRGGVDTPVSGSTAGGRAAGWVWNTPTEDFSMYGPVTRNANWEPVDMDRFNVIANAPITIYVYSPQTNITVPPTAIGITYGDPISNSTLNATAAVAMSVGKNPGPDVQIPGSWYWTQPATIAANAGTFTAGVTFEPTDLTTTPDIPDSGYVKGYADVSIPVAKATPVLVAAQTSGIKNGDTLSASTIGVYSFKGVFDEVVTGSLSWKPGAGSVVPSDSLGGTGGTGVYQAAAVFTPDSSFGMNYKEIDVLVPVNVAANKDALATYEQMVLGIDIHEENYTAADVAALHSALAAANTVLADALATQTEIDHALAVLKAAFEGLRHDHPELKSSHDIAYGGVNHLTRFGDTVIIEFKGDIRDVTGFRLNSTDYPLTSGGTDTYNITEGGTTVGTITKGSAVVTLPTAFADRLANGTHIVEVIFADATGTGYGTAELIVDRSSGGGGNDPDKPAILPQTGDTISSGLILVATFSLCGLLLILLALRRKRLPKSVIQ